jgi:hypothetical protein
MIGEASGIVPDRGMNILYRVVMNTLGKLTDAGLTQANYSTTQQKANTRLSSSTPNGILAGSVVAVGTTSGTIIAALGTGGSDGVYTPVGIAENNAVGYPYESSSGVGSGKCPYLCGSGSVFATDLYETADSAAADTTANYTAGCSLYCSPNGLLTNGKLANGSSDSTGKGATVIGICLTAPSTSDPFMVVQMRI